MNSADDLHLSAVIPEPHLTLFTKMGLEKPHDLRREGRDANARARLAQKTGLPLGQIETWVIQADLLELYTDPTSGITLTEAERLTHLGIDGLRGLRGLSEAGRRTLARRWASSAEKRDAEPFEARLSQLQTLAQTYFDQGAGQAIVTHPHNLLVVSDLHLGQGTAQPHGKMDRNEDFLYDDDFANLLLYQQQQRLKAAGLGTSEDRPWRLLFNGDIVDFLQVTGAPARDVIALEQAIVDQLGPDFLADASKLVPAPPAVPATDPLSRFFDQLNVPRKRLVLLRQHLQSSPPAADRPPLALHQLEAEADILISAGDNNLDTNRLTDLEELLRIPSELDEMTRQLNEIGHNGQTAPLDLKQKNFLSYLHTRIADSQPGNSLLTQSEFNFLAQQIGTAWTLLATGRFAPDLLKLVVDLGKLFALHPQTDPLTPGVWEPQYMDRPRSAFARYRDLLIRYRAQQATLGVSLAHLELPNLTLGQRQAKADRIGSQLRRAFETIFVDVPQWRVGQENPYTLRYEAARWGLGSSQAENIWRVYQIYRGHPVFFQALAWFVASGNEMIVQTGNHDIELFWPEVRSALREVLVLAYDTLNNSAWRALVAPLALTSQPADVAMENVVKQRVSFTHWLYYEPGVAYIEHGCQYETANSWPTYLDPRYVGTVPDHQLRRADGSTVPGKIEQPALFWPWGSLIVRYIFNQMEQIHPFADQIKPMTRYFTWAFSRDFLRSIGLLILSLPGIARVVNQILDRGVVEGWFGPSYTLTGLPNMILRGASTWLTWLRRLLHPEWLTAAAARRRLRWPILPWPAWKQIVTGDQARRSSLARLLPDFYWQPHQVERNILDVSPSAAEQPASQYGSVLWQRLLEIALQIVLILLFLAGASRLAGWQFPTRLGLLAQIGIPRRLECQTLALLPNGPPDTLLGFLQPWGLALLPLLALGIYMRLQLEQSQPTRRQRLAAALTALAGVWLIIFLLTNLYCGFAYYHLPAPGPWASFTTFPTWLVWVLLFLLATLVLRRRVDERRLQQQLRQLRQNRLLSQTLRLRRFVSVLIALLGVAVLAFFVIFYGQPNDQYIQPGWLGLLPWLALVCWLTLASFWWGSTVLMLFFAGSATLGLISLVARGLIALNVQTATLPFWPLLLLLLAGLFLYAWLPQWLPNRLHRPARLVGFVVLVLLGLLWTLSWSSLFADFFSRSQWENLLPLWLLWGFVGLWLLESKENPFPHASFQGWLGDKLGARWDWLRPLLDNTFTLVIEIGLLILLLAVSAQAYALRGRAVTGLLANFTGERAAIVQLMALILCLLVMGIGGRNLLSWLQTDNFPDRLTSWLQRARWQLQLLLGGVLLSLIAGTVWLATGPALLNQTTAGLTAAAVLALLGLVGWFMSANLSSTELPKPARYYLLLGLSWFGLLVLWLQALRNLSRAEPLPLAPGFRLGWYGLTVALLVAFIGLARPTRSGNRNHIPSPFQPALLQATAWGVLLMAGALATAVLVRAGLGQPFPPLVSDDPALVAELSTLETEVQAALFSLRLEQALRLSYDPAPLAQAPTAYLTRLQGSDARTSVYFTTLETQTGVLAQTQGAALESVATISGTAPETLTESLQLSPPAVDGLAYPLLHSQTEALTDYFAGRQADDLSLSQPEVSLADQTLEMAALAQTWEQLTDAAVADCLAASDLPHTSETTAACAGQLAAVWEARHQPGEDLKAFISRLNEQESATDTALARVGRRLGGLALLPAPGFWQQLNLLVWRGLRNVPELTILADPVKSLNATLDPGTLATELSLLDNQRQDQLHALQALHQFAKQRRNSALYTNLMALMLLSVALAGSGGFLLLALLRYLALRPQTQLDSKTQLERIVAIGRRQQSGFVRKFTRTATMVLSFSFGAGLFIGAYLVISGLFTGDFLIALRSGAALTIISWLGRRVVLFIPASAGHGGGYLAQAAAEIQAVLDRGDPEQNALYPVPYYFFGHDHVAAYEPVGGRLGATPSAASQQQGAWYVNTGAWVQAYTGEVRYRREDEEYSIFVEVIPGPDTTGNGVAPHLLRWDRTVARPSQLFHLIEVVPESLPKRVVKTLLRWLGLRQAYTWPDA